MNLFAYIRVSGKSQVTREGPDRQRESIRTFCGVTTFQGIKGITLLGEFFEEGVSGTIEGMDRPKFAEMVEAIECRRANGQEIAGFVIERIDRFARDLMVQEVLFAECRKRNISVFAADRGELIDLASDDGDPTRKLIRQVMGALAEWEKSQTVLKLGKARKAVALKQGYCGVRPYKHGTKLEQCMIDFLAREVANTTPLEEVAAKLNFSGYRTRAGQPWTAKSAWRLLKQTGLHTPKDPSLYRMANLKKSRLNT
jgi:DNA invertase Pin-like site-specific DNA recombinase